MECADMNRTIKRFKFHLENGNDDDDGVIF